MSRYMLLLYADEKAGLALPKEAMAAWMAKMGAYGDALKKAGALISNGALGVTSAATTVHVENGEMQVHNGPYAETREQLGGYYLIEAANLAEAQKWAAHCPAALWGTIEIRQIQ